MSTILSISLGFEVSLVPEEVERPGQLRHHQHRSCPVAPVNGQFVWGPPTYRRLELIPSLLVPHSHEELGGLTGHMQL